MRVLITGGHGTIGRTIRKHLDPEKYEFTLMDISQTDEGDTVVADVRDYDDIRPHFEDQDAVIHLARVRGMGNPHDRSIGWTVELEENLKGINNVYEAAVDADLEKILYASSNHAVGMAEVRNRPDVYHDEGITVDETEPHRPDSLYGLTKCYGEDLGRLAAEAHDIQFYGLRFGAIPEAQYDHPYGYAERGVDNGDWERGSEEYDEQVARMKALWHSHRDVAYLVECCLEDDTVEWDHFYGVSANDRRWLDDLEHARETIGYEPMDNGDAWDAPPT